MVMVFAVMIIVYESPAAVLLPLGYPILALKLRGLSDEHRILRDFFFKYAAYSMMMKRKMYFL